MPIRTFCRWFCFLDCDFEERGAPATVFVALGDFAASHDGAIAVAAARLLADAAVRVQPFEHNFAFALQLLIMYKFALDSSSRNATSCNRPLTLACLTLSCGFFFWLALVKYFPKFYSLHRSLSWHRLNKFLAPLLVQCSFLAFNDHYLFKSRLQFHSRACFLNCLLVRARVQKHSR